MFDLIAANGKDAHVILRFTWGLTEGAVAIALFHTGSSGAVLALRALLICVSLPFTAFLICLRTSFWQPLLTDQCELAYREVHTDWSLPSCGSLFVIAGRCYSPPPCRRSGAVKALRALSVCAGLPFAASWICICTSLRQALLIDLGIRAPHEEHRQI